MSKLAIIGGSGLQKIPDGEFLRDYFENTPFGMPSSPLRHIKIGESELVFLARHGENHTISPSEINYRANIYALKALGVTQIISVAAVGSLKENIRPGDFVIIDQFFDRTSKRNDTFFGNGIVAHVSFGNPICPVLHKKLIKAAHNVGATVHNCGTYVNIEGPAFSSRAEADFYRNVLEADVVGMTNLTEAKLAREAGICYASLAHVTDYDCWRDNSEEVSVSDILKIIDRNIELTRDIILKFINQIFLSDECNCANALSSALITPIEKINESEKEKLKIILNL
ncbi:MAG: S-methyl-5'-thioadenosine phosphorylase [Chlamydiae bacterium]|nr:MAG: S-methyl-5'-thioadenosine phosphorylase [Chlamydiota bacterium]